MSDGSLTQDEIDALLQGSPSFDLGGGDAGGAPAAGSTGQRPCAPRGLAPERPSTPEGVMRATAAALRHPPERCGGLVRPDSVSIGQFTYPPMGRYKTALPV